ncbi:MAG: 3-methyladenine DNA glycosylase [Nocardioidaceae bacterium]
MEDLSTTTLPLVLGTAEWKRREQAHHARVDRLLSAHLARRRAGEAHPVEDFLFSYYSFRPSALRRWNPGPGVLLEGHPEQDPPRGYVVQSDRVGLDPSYAVSRHERIRWVRDLLTATAARAPSFGCLGLHEWAMVYRQRRDDLRHAAWPLRLGSHGTDAVVESHRIACTHFDAFRFFTAPARPRNAVEPARDLQQELEQPGCLHVGMDLYKWAYKLAPMTPSDLVADCFELARDIRELDMRASPYDLTGLGYTPVRIETVEGKQRYAAEQRSFTSRAAPLRQRLVTVCDALLDIRT